MNPIFLVSIFLLATVCFFSFKGAALLNLVKFLGLSLCLFVATLVISWWMGISMRDVVMLQSVTKSDGAMALIYGVSIATVLRILLIVVKKVIVFLGAK